MTSTQQKNSLLYCRAALSSALVFAASTAAIASPTPGERAQWREDSYVWAPWFVWVCLGAFAIFAIWKVLAIKSAIKTKLSQRGITNPKVRASDVKAYFQRNKTEVFLLFIYVAFALVFFFNTNQKFHRYMIKIELKEFSEAKYSKVHYKAMAPYRITHDAALEDYQ